MDSTEQIEHRAAAWLTKRDSGEWTEDDDSGLKAWIEEATAHRVAYIRLEMVWEESQRLKALAAGLPAGFGEKNDWTLPFFDPRQLTPGGDTKVSEADAPFDSSELMDHPLPQLPATVDAGARGRVRVQVFAAAAAVVLTVGAAYLGRGLFAGNRYTTQVGVITSVPLQDGSSITLNTASKIRVDLNSQERHVDLAQGEAFFEVAKDANRPFVVTAGHKRITVVGTKFSVRRENDELRVVVTEGRVRIEDASTESKAQDKGMLLAAGSIARTRKEAVLVQKTSLPQTEEVLSWRTGYLTFRDTPLREAIAQFNQYNPQQMSTSDAAVADIPLTGKFKATNYDAFVRLLEDGYAIKAARAGDTITLAR